MHFRPFAKLDTVGDPLDAGASVNTIFGPVRTTKGLASSPGDPVTFIIAAGAITLALVWIARGVATGKFGDHAVDDCADIAGRIARARRQLQDAEGRGAPAREIGKLRSKLRAFEATRGAMDCVAGLGRRRR